MSIVFFCSPTRRLLAPRIRLRAPDPALVAFPTQQLADCVQVFRNAVSSDDESRIAEDLTVVLDKEGETAYAEATLQHKIVRNRGTDLHGFEPNVKIRDWNKMTDRVVRGIAWSPTLAAFCKEVAPLAFKYDPELVSGPNAKMTHDELVKQLMQQLEQQQAEEVAKAGRGDELERDTAFFSGATNDHPSQQQQSRIRTNAPGTPDKSAGDDKAAADKAAAEELIRKRLDAIPRPKPGRIVAPLPGELIVPDTAKVIEHQLPGYEMHVEQPIVGSAFLLLNLMSPTVVTFDDESTNRMGEVMLPERSLMRVSGEVRWGWRWGERTDRTHVFSMTRRHVTPGIRYGITLFRYAKHLVDQRKLQETVEAGVRKITEADKAQQQQQQTGEGKLSGDGVGGGGGDASKKPDVALVDGGEHEQWSRLSEEEKRKKRESEKAEEEAFAHNVLKGQGMLGGDLPTASMAMGKAAQLGTAPHQTGATMGDKMKRFHGYASDLGRIGTFMQKMNEKQNEAGPRSVSDAEIQSEIQKMRASAAVQDDGFQFDLEHAQLTWEQMAERSQHYKAKLQQMTYEAIRDTTVEGAENGDANEAVVPETVSKKKPVPHDPKYFTGPGVVGNVSAGDSEQVKLDKAGEVLRKAKERGMTSADVKKFTQELDVEPFDPVKAAENISQNWRGKMHRPPPSSSVPPPPSSMM